MKTFYNEMEDFKTLLTEYLKQYPKEENPINWHALFFEEEIYNFLKNRKGRKIRLKTKKDVLDGGQLYYA